MKIELQEPEYILGHNNKQKLFKVTYIDNGKIVVREGVTELGLKKINKEWYD